MRWPDCVHLLCLQLFFPLTEVVAMGLRVAVGYDQNCFDALFAEEGFLLQLTGQVPALVVLVALLQLNLVAAKLRPLERCSERFPGFSFEVILLELRIHGAQN